jgi:hypothetical protein
MRTPDPIAFHQVGNGSRHFEDTMISSGREIQPAEGLPEQVFPGSIRDAVFIDILYTRALIASLDSP